MSISLHGHGAVNNGPSGTTFTVPTVSNGDLMLLPVVGLGTAIVVNTPAAWSLYFSFSSGTSFKTYMFTRVAASEPANYAVTTSGGVGTISGQIRTYQSSSALTINVDPASNGQGNASSINCTAPSITLAYPGEMLVGLWAYSTGESGTSVPAGFANSDAETTQPSFAAADASNQSQGATGTQTVSRATAATNIGILLGLYEVQLPLVPPSRAAKRRDRIRRREKKRDAMGYLPQVQPPVVPPQTAVTPRQRKRDRVRRREKKRDAMGWLPQAQPPPPPPLPKPPMAPRRRKRSRNRLKHRDAMHWLPNVIPPPPQPFPWPKKKQRARRMHPRKRRRQPGPELILPPPFTLFPMPFPRKKERARARTRKRSRSRSDGRPAWFPPPPVIPPNVYITPNTWVELGGSLIVAGQLGSGSIVLPAKSVTDFHVAEYAGPGSPIQAVKVQRQHLKEHGQAGAAVAEQAVLHVVRGATYTVVEFVAWAGVAATGSDKCTIDLLRNGISVLTAAITLDKNTKAYAGKKGTLAAIANPQPADVFEVKVSGVVGASQQRVGARMTIREDPQ